MSSTGESGLSALVVVPVFGQLHLAERAVRSVDEHTAETAPLLVIDDAGAERLTRQELDSWLGQHRNVTFISHEDNRGFVASANESFRCRSGRDVVIVNSDVVVFPGWLESLASAARSGDRIASVTAATNAGSIATDAEAAGCESADGVKALAAAAAARQTPPRRIPVGVGHCLYLSDAALADVGDFDPAFSPGYGEEVDWSFRAARRGWVHLLSPSTLVWHEAGASFGRKTWLRRRHELVLARRYPREFLRLRSSGPR